MRTVVASVVGFSIAPNTEDRTRGQELVERYWEAWKRSRKSRLPPEEEEAPRDMG